MPSECHPNPFHVIDWSWSVQEGAAGFGVSNVNPLMVACVHSSLSVLQKAGGVAATRKKSLLLTGYLEVEEARWRQVE